MRKPLRCRLGFHGSYDLIGKYGFTQHIGCPKCGKQWALSHMERACLPWSEGFADMFRSHGHDVDTPLAEWQAYRAWLANPESRP